MPARDVSYLEGQLLVAMPDMKDPRFEKSVIYVCAHTADGAMGLILNQRAPNISFPELLGQLDILDELKADGQIVLPDHLHKIDVHIGGPVETGRGFILHSSDYHIPESTLAVSQDICLTSTIEILRAIAAGRGPEQLLLALGYAGWAPGQLESEIQANGWLTCPADEALVFGPDIEHKYEHTMARIGVNPAFLISEAGHA